MATFLPLCLFCLIQSAATTYDLDLRLEVGSTYSHNFQSDISIRQTVMGMEQEIATKVSYTLDFLVQGLADDTYQMSVTYRTMAMKLSTAMGEVAMSSEDVSDPSDITQSLLGHLVDKPFAVEMSRVGRIEKIEGLEEVFQSIFDNYPDIPEMQKAQLLAQLEQGYGENAFRGNMELITAVLPDKPIAIGESWRTNLEVQTTMPLIAESTFELTEVNSSSIVIEGTGTMRTADAVTEVNGMQAKYVTTGTNQSKILLDPTTRWISSAEVSQDMEGDVELLPNDAVPDGMKFPLKMNIQTTIRNN